MQKKFASAMEDGIQVESALEASLWTRTVSGLCGRSYNGADKRANPIVCHPFTHPQKMSYVFVSGWDTEHYTQDERFRIILKIISEQNPGL